MTVSFTAKSGCLQRSKLSMLIIYLQVEGSSTFLTENLCILEGEQKYLTSVSLLTFSMSQGVPELYFWETYFFSGRGSRVELPETNLPR